MERVTNLKNKEFCILTWVYGRKYQSWIPIYVYSIHKNYPSYDIKICIDSNLSIDVQKILEKYNLSSCVEIIENVFDYTLQKTLRRDIEKRCFRWLLNDLSNIQDYKYLYIGDIDIYIIKESPSLLEQHISDMENGNKIYSNAIRLTLKDYFRKKSSFNHLFRLTGLHFIDVAHYFKAVNKWQRRILKYLLGNRVRVVDSIFFNDDERCLWLLNFLSRNQSPSESYELSNKVFRPLHGLHFAIGREYETYSELLHKNSGKNKEHKEYYEKFNEEYNTDVELRKLVFDSSKIVQDAISKTCIMWGGILDKDGIKKQQ